MTKLQSNITAGVLTLFPYGRVDSSSAPEIEAQIDKALAEHPHESVVLDVENLEYISSAGLRVVLRLRKNEPTLTIVNAGSEIYEIFEMTGFTEMMPVQKAYRRVSVDGCEVIGQGANGKVYRLDADTIIKVYMNPESLDDIHRERELARRAFVLGIPTAIPYDVVKVGDLYGSVFELLNAKSFAKLIQDDPSSLPEVARMSVDILKKLHSTEVSPDDMPDYKAYVLEWADYLKDYIPTEKWQKLHNLIAAVPDSNCMIHGDYHLKNVMLQNGEALIIDMDTLAHGAAIFEFMSIFNAYIGFSALDPANCAFLGLTPEQQKEFWNLTLRYYLDTDDEEKIQNMENKAALLGYMRMYRRSIRYELDKTELDRAKKEYYREQVLDLIDKVDSLEF